MVENSEISFIETETRIRVVSRPPFLSGMESNRD